VCRKDKEQQMTTADDYVNRVLDRMPRELPRRAQIGAELRSHIAERVAAGYPLEDVLRQLGDPVALADSYLAEEPLVAAPFGRRLAAKLVDVMLFFAGFALILGSTYAIARSADVVEIMWLLFMPGIIVFSFVFPIYMIGSEYRCGYTPGKRIFDLRVVRESGGRIGLGQSVVRQLPFLFQVFSIDALFVLFTERRQRAFELLSKTRVIDAAAWLAAQPEASTADSPPRSGSQSDPTLTII
jgi:uncharacterized RDD family membrane protein YckC